MAVADATGPTSTLPENRYEARCPPVPQGSVSDDEAPVLDVAGAETPLLPWLAARGVSEAKAMTWLAKRTGLSVEDMAIAASLSCRAISVGPSAEQALVCELPITYSLAQSVALVVTVRARAPVALLQAGLGLRALDFSDAHWLDLALSYREGTLVLRDRAPDGTTLIEPPSECRARAKIHDECAQILAAEPNPERLARTSAGGERFDPLGEYCMVHRDPQTKAIVVWTPDDAATGLGAYPAQLHDCASGLPRLTAAQRENGGLSPEERAEWDRAVRFAKRACENRGAWVWSKGIFVKRSTP